MCSRARQRHPNYRHDCVSPETTGVSRPDPGPLLFYREPSVLRPAPPDRGPRPVRARPPRVDGRTERRGARTPRVSCSRCQGPSSSSPPSASRRQCTPAPSVPSRLRWTCETPLEPIARPLPHRLRRRDGAAHRRRSGRRWRSRWHRLLRTAPVQRRDRTVPSPDRVAIAEAPGAPPRPVGPRCVLRAARRPDARGRDVPRESSRTSASPRSGPG
jgi:hypothetical protein